MSDGGLAIAPMLRRRLLQLWCRTTGTALAASLGSPLARLRPSHAASGHAVRLPAGRALRWVAFYGQTADEDVLATYDLVVLDPMFLGSLERVAGQGSRICGYLSLGRPAARTRFLAASHRASCWRKTAPGREPGASISAILRGGTSWSVT